MQYAPWTVYIVGTESDTLYTGITTDLERRLRQHRSGKGAKYFSLSAPMGVLFTEQHDSRSSASRREAEIKKMSRKQKEALIAGVKERC